MPTIDKRVAASADDASESSAGGVSVAATIFNVDATGEWAAARFQVAIPAGATITAAWLSLRLDSGTEDEPDVRFYGEKAANAAVYTTASNSISNRARTTASVPWSSTNLGSAAATYDTPSLVSIIQELVDTYDYSGGTNYMAIMWTSENNVTTRDLTVTFFDGNAATAPLLHIEYTGGSTYVLTATTGAIALTHTAASLRHTYRAVADASAYSLTGIAASLEKGYLVSAGSSAFALTGQDATLTYTPGEEPGSYTLVAEPAGYGLSAQAATLRAERKLAVETAPFVLSGQSATFTKTLLLVGEPGTFEWQGVDAALFGHFRLSATESIYLVLGGDVLLWWSGTEIPETPAERRWIVAAEVRVVKVAAGNRTFVVLPERRSLVLA